MQMLLQSFQRRNFVTFKLNESCSPSELNQRHDPESGSVFVDFLQVFKSSQSILQIIMVTL